MKVERKCREAIKSNSMATLAVTGVMELQLVEFRGIKAILKIN